MRPEEHDAAYLWDILRACDAIERFVRGKTLDQYLRDEMMQAAVERKLEVVGEAARKVSDAFKSAHPEIQWKAIVGQRNVMIHDYGQIRQDRVWGVTQKYIPELASRLKPFLPPLPPQLDL